LRGKVVEVEEGKHTVEEAVVRLEGPEGKTEVKLMQTWPVRRPRPYRQKLDPSELLFLGQRIADTFFPVAKGGTAAIPGGFGTGKTVFLHQVAKWADARIVVYVGCGERGNEMCDVLVHFPELKDPRTGRPLMERTVLIANTSNMPVAAREASVYTGITLGEYFRDMGYDVALMADSTSRWAEAMREISGRLEEMPGEEGFPAYLASRLAEFYERAGRVRTLGREERYGSLTVLGAVSPPGGDLSEPVSVNTLRIVKVFWALDTSLAYRRHFPAIHWLTSYSLYVESVGDWWAKRGGGDWKELRAEAMALLQREAELEEIVKLIGADALPEPERAVLEAARMVRENFLQQFAFDEVDTYCPPEKQVGMLRLLLKFYRKAVEAARGGISVTEIRKLPVREELARMKKLPPEEFGKAVKELERKIEEQFGGLGRAKG
ncbi:MAG: V-type ATP synthase subunit A, partial [Hadesarchaea archaeon]